MCAPDPSSDVFSEAMGFGAGLGGESREGENRAGNMLVGPSETQCSLPRLPLPFPITSPRAVSSRQFTQYWEQSVQLTSGAGSEGLPNWLRGGLWAVQCGEIRERAACGRGKKSPWTTDVEQALGQVCP